ncbi:MAG: cytochrome c3 family protein [Chloroflexi bacterium]|nr:cytochrome c3 family protein [Chloroflexota bacterium]
MRRRELFFSPSAIFAFGIIVLALLAWYAWRGQTIFSPDRLSAAGEPAEALNGWANHAEFEAECALCHQPLKVEMAVLCLDCHTPIAEEIDAKRALHGLLPEGAGCLACHTEHLGTDADLRALARPYFDHSLAAFSLALHAGDYGGQPLECSACHPGPGFEFRAQDCQDCHAEDSPAFMAEHLAAFGGECLDCHDGVDRMSDFDHAVTDFSLEGEHAGLECQACHSPAQDVPHRCQDCHAEPEAHRGRFGIDCVACHTPAGWSPAAYDHPDVLAADCAGCHLPDRPEPHYPGQCSLCHGTEAWTPATFDHRTAQAEDCQMCHAAVRPERHYPGQCSACHSTEAWTPATFDHRVAGATDCAACHAGQKPEQHYPGQCSACHSTEAWTPATFDHQVAGATDCQLCHANDQPANHYGSQCGACHSTRGWTPASFNHKLAGATNCVSCHENDRPANHFPGQCSQCHSTENWKANFKHSFPMNHGDANGRCDACHVTASFGVPCTNCHRSSEITKKHNEEGIFDISNCLNCHPNGDKEKGGGGGDDD